MNEPDKTKELQDQLEFYEFLIEDCQTRIHSYFIVIEQLQKRVSEHYNRTIVINRFNP